MDLDPRLHFVAITGIVAEKATIAISLSKIIPSSPQKSLNGVSVGGINPMAQVGSGQLLLKKQQSKNFSF